MTPDQLLKSFKDPSSSPVPFETRQRQRKWDWKEPRAGFEPVTTSGSGRNSSGATETGDQVDGIGRGRDFRESDVVADF